MILCRVQGQVVSTIKHDAYANRRILLLDRLDPAGNELGSYVVAIDAVDADVGQTVLVLEEGNSARQIVDDAMAPIRSVIIGIVDEIQTA
ncbi:MAG: EutN/CcmL family microcompartment protein [Planctomycetota bacterium]